MQICFIATLDSSSISPGDVICIAHDNGVTVASSRGEDLEVRSVDYVDETLAHEFLCELSPAAETYVRVERTFEDPTIEHDTLWFSPIG